MIQDYIDIHCHSTAFDGTLSPSVVVRLAQQIGLTTLFLTDRDTMAGFAEAGVEVAALGSNGRPHLAAVLVRKGHATSMRARSIASSVKPSQLTLTRSGFRRSKRLR